MVLPLLLLALGLGAAPQEGGTPPPAPAPVDAPPKPPAPEAAAAWGQITAAMTVPGEHRPIQAFSLRADVRSRQGVQTNDFKAEYRYLAPHFIRFQLEGGRETGRGPGRGDKAYWLRDKDVVTPLSGREFKADRDLVRRMTTLAQNVVSLANPAGIRTRELVLRPEDAPPPLLPKSLAGKARRLTWVEFVSPDFDLFQDEAPADPTRPRNYRVIVGADKKSHVPYLVMVHEEVVPGAPRSEPLLFALEVYRKVDGYLLPHRIRVHNLDLGQPELAFGERAAQEIDVTFADLTPELVEADFAAKP